MLNIDLNGQVAIVTGSTQGIGAGVAKVLARAGCHVAGCGQRAIDTRGAQEFIDSVRKEGRGALYKSVDVKSKEAINEFVLDVYNKFGKIDILVSNAGVNVFKGADKCSEEEWQFNMDLNLKSHWIIAQSSRPYLAKSKNGVILIMTSNHAYSTIPGCFPYNIAKTALVGMVRSIAIEWGPDIRVVGVAPGFIETEGTQSWFDKFDDHEKEKQKTIKRHPVGKLGSVDEVGALCAYLASDFAGFITGTTYLMDGGRSALMQDK